MISVFFQKKYLNINKYYPNSQITILLYQDDYSDNIIAQRKMLDRFLDLLNDNQHLRENGKNISKKKFIDLALLLPVSEDNNYLCLNMKFMKRHRNQWNKYRILNISLFASLAFKYDRFYFIYTFCKVYLIFKSGKTDVCEIYPKHGKIEDGEVSLMCETEPYNIPFWAAFKTFNLEIVESKEHSNILNSKGINQMIILIKNQELNGERMRKFEEYWGLIYDNSI